MSKILKKTSATVVYELIESEENNSYGIRAYFDKGDVEGTGVMAVNVENVTNDINKIEEMLKYIVKVCALPNELPEIIEDLKFEF